jgi:hypothetical protein
MAPLSVTAATIELAAGEKCVASAVEVTDDGTWRVCWVTPTRFIQVTDTSRDSSATERQSGEQFEAWARPLASLLSVSLSKQAVIPTGYGSIGSKSGYALRFQDGAELALPLDDSWAFKSAGVAAEKFVTVLLAHLHGSGQPELE